MSIGAPQEPGGSRTHAPATLQKRPAVHDPQEPLQPSEPQVRPVQFRTQCSHAVWSSEHALRNPEHVPQEPPQPSSPHTFPEQSGVQVHERQLGPDAR
jgi:hypothetical protein